ncbi:aggregation-promoting factor C-terminal-like domain-containing protein [Catenuloplanes japonicus]|uniref:aggregation-promoting factor C-terminal-like domain-containing protein n=1 Tax=Catenuloplanes japonicus TaxID=33876 RepID=UPI000524ACFF|nr:lytic transglycosylase domain-containing protein [Catenuloplanes japonicus]
MSPLWSRYGVRSASVALLLSGVAGGVYLSQDREIQQQSVSAQAEFDATLAEEQYIKSRHAEYTKAHAREAESERVAAEKATEAAQAAAKRAAAAEESASRKAERAKAEAEAKKAAEEAAAEKPANSGTVAFDGPIPASCSEFSGNRATGCAILLDSGFGIDQFPCLNKLWTKESNWSHTALNSSSGAFGIPQALPGGKMASAGSDWETNPATQIEWGLGYIKGRYGTPCEAWAHSQSVGWY